MSWEQIRQELEGTARPSAEALRRAAEHGVALAPAVIAIVNKAADGAYLLPTQERLLFYGVYAVAASRHTALFRPLLRLLRRPYLELERLLGDAVTETLPPLVLSLYDGDAAPILELIEDRALDGYVRWSLLRALARLTFDGAVARETTLAVLDRFDRERWAPDGDPAWQGWQDAILLLPLGDGIERLRAAWQDGRCVTMPSDREICEEELAAAQVDPANPARFTNERLAPFDDPTELLTLFGGGAAEQPETAKPSELIPGDPAAKIALDDDEIEWLAGFLDSDHVPETAMSFEQIDGLFTALVIGPGTVLPSEYLREVWGAPEGKGPHYDSWDQGQYVLTLLMRHWNTIAARLERGYPHLPAIERTATAFEGTGWPGGFLRGMALRGDSWISEFNEDPLRTLIAPVMALAMTSEPSLKASTPKLQRNALASLPIAMLGMYRYWRRDPSIAPRRKIGRNERCRCGSGKKYKFCCGRVVPAQV